MDFPNITAFLPQKHAIRNATTCPWAHSQDGDPGGHHHLQPCPRVLALSCYTTAAFVPQQITFFYLFIIYLLLFIYFYKFIYLIFNLILAALGLRCCAQAFLQLQRAGATLCCGAWASHCSGFSCCGARALGVRASVVVSRGLQSAGSVAVAHGLSCSVACGIFPDQGSNPCPLHWQADS